MNKLSIVFIRILEFITIELYTSKLIRFSISITISDESNNKWYFEN